MKWPRMSNFAGPGDYATIPYRGDIRDPRHQGFPNDDTIIHCDCGWSGLFGDMETLNCPECDKLLLGVE